MLSADIVSKIRAGGLQTEFAFLISLYDIDRHIIQHMTNFADDITSRSILYTSASFTLQLPRFQSGTRGDGFALSFPYFDNGGIAKEDYKRIDYVTTTMVDPEYPDTWIFKERRLYFTEYTRTDSNITFSFSPDYIKDASFPFTKYNSKDHPGIYEETKS